MENTVKLKPSLLKRLALLMVCSIFVATGIFLLEDNSFMAWLNICFFGIGVIVFTIQLLPNASYLKLTSEGFEVRSLYRSYFTKWTEVTRFRVGSTGKTKMVRFNYTNRNKKMASGKFLARLLSGNEGALPDTYGMKAEQLAGLMNDWKYRKLSDKFM